MNQKSNPLFSIWPNIALTICISLTFIALIFFAAYDHTTDKSNNRRMVSHLKFEEVRNRLDLLSDLLTANATLASETGDPGWISSYEEYKSEWNKIIKNNPDMKDYVQSTTNTLFQIEDSVLEESRQNRLDIATSLMNSSTYQRNTEALDKKLDEVKSRSLILDMNILTELDDSNTQRLHVLWTTIGIAFMIWALAFFLINRYRKTVIKYAQEVLLHNETLEKLNEELTKSNTELDNFVYSASHHLLGPVKSSIGLMAVFDKGKDELSLEKFLEMLEVNLNKIDDNIKAVIFLSENRRSEIVKTEFEFEPLLMEAINQAELKSNIQGVSIETEIKNCKAFCTDKNRLKVILTSIISNALQYQDKTKSQKLHVTGFCSGTEVELTIEDNGIGISEEKLSNVFDMFVKLNDASSGPGLGLYIAREILKKLSGTIQIRSTLGQGTTAKIIIPI